MLSSMLFIAEGLSPAAFAGGGEPISFSSKITAKTTTKTV